jgi:4a-hydroxytetrahydrobiopterin dehydratase
MPEDVPAGWSLANNVLSRSIPRADFVDALALMVEIGRLAEAANHHPDMGVRGYRTVHISVTTHSAGNTVTSKDIDLAQKINDLPEESIRLTYIDLRRRFVS